MNKTLFKLTDPITRATVKQFEADHGFKPTKEADLTEFGYAWGDTNARPNVPDSQTIEPTEPVLDGAFVTVAWTVRDKTQAELLAGLPWHTYLEARSFLSTWVNDLTSQVTGQYPDVVQRGWHLEEAAAIAQTTDGLTPTAAELALLERLAAKKERTVQEQADKILEKATVYRAIQEHTQDLFAETEHALEKAASPIEFPAIFAAAKAKAAPLAQAYGLSV